MEKQAYTLREYAELIAPRDPKKRDVGKLIALVRRQVKNGLLPYFIGKRGMYFIPQQPELYQFKEAKTELPKPQEQGVTVTAFVKELMPRDPKGRGVDALRWLIIQRIRKGSPSAPRHYVGQNGWYRITEDPSTYVLEDQRSQREKRDDFYPGFSYTVHQGKNGRWYAAQRAGSNWIVADSSGEKCISGKLEIWDGYKNIKDARNLAIAVWGYGKVKK